MSWLPNPFKSLQLSDDEESASDVGGVAGGGSVKEDLSSIGETIGLQLRGVAAFLAPPPPPQCSPPRASRTVADECSSGTRSPRLDGIRHDLAEIGGSLKSSLSLLSSNKAVTKISKLASNFLKLDEEEGAEEEEEVEEDHGVGITDEVVDLVTEISERPECWTDFPLPLSDDDFTMSEAQAEHICVIEQLVPSLADLRTRLSSDMNKRQFWMIYFILLLPRLDENSLNLLSSPQIIEARNALLSMLLHKRNSLVPDSKKDLTDNSSQSDTNSKKDLTDNSSQSDTNFDQKRPQNSEASRGMQTDRKGNTGKCSLEEDANTVSIDAQRQLQNEDDMSFSDLEDDDSDVSRLSTRRYSPGLGQDVDAHSSSSSSSSSSDGSGEWVRLNENAADSGGRRSREGRYSFLNRDSEVDEPRDWLKIDEFYNNYF